MAGPPHVPPPAWGTVCQENYRDLLRDVRCRGCFRVGAWTLEEAENGTGRRIRCAGETCPDPYLYGKSAWVRKSLAVARRPALGVSAADFWGEHGDYCFGCGLDGAHARTLGIARERHHTVPYATAGHEGVMIPLCGVCHAHATAQQRCAQAFRRLLQANEGAA